MPIKSVMPGQCRLDNSVLDLFKGVDGFIVYCVLNGQGAKPRFLPILHICQPGCRYIV